MDAGARWARVALVLGSSAIALAGCALEPEGARIAGGPTGPGGAPISMATPLSTGSPSVGSTEAGSTEAGSTKAGSTKAGSTKGSGSGKAADQDLSIPFACPPPSITVLDGKELRKALKSAEPGD